MALLIVCEPADLHANALAWALAAYETEALIWNPAQPWAGRGSIRIDSYGSDYRFKAKGGEITPTSIDSVWSRRSLDPPFPGRPGDEAREAFENQLKAFQGLLSLLPGTTFRANAPGAAAEAASRIRQLFAARNVGLPIPPTLVTDDAAEARAFVVQSRGSTVVHRLAGASCWERPTRLSCSVATQARACDFDDSERLTWSPAIYQRFVPKAHGVRISVFGKTCVAARILDPDPTARHGWRCGLKAAACSLPPAVEQRIHDLMEELGLAMATIDMVVTPDGGHVFLGLHEQGPFLWVEEMCPDVPILDIAARFFACRDPDFRSEALPSRGITLTDFIASPAMDSHKQEEAEIASTLEPLAKEGVAEGVAFRNDKNLSSTLHRRSSRLQPPAYS